MTPERVVKIAKDIFGMLAGTAGVIIQAMTNTWNWFALCICALLLGVPLWNIKALLPQNGTKDTQELLSQSPRSQRQLHSSSQSSSLSNGDDNE